MGEEKIALFFKPDNSATCFIGIADSEDEAVKIGQEYCSTKYRATMSNIKKMRVEEGEPVDFWV